MYFGGGKLMTAIEPIAEEGVWTVAEVKAADDLVKPFPDEVLAELEAFVQRMRRRGKTLDDVEQEDLQSQAVTAFMQEVYRELKSGRGFAVLGGLPVFDRNQADLEMVFWALGTVLGRGLSQSVMGDRIGHVRDFTQEDPNARAYRNANELNPHTDHCDIAALFCLRGAKSGGVSLLSSALSVHNTLLEHDPDALDVLYEGFYYHRRGEEQPGDDPVSPYRVPVFSNTEGKVSSRWVKPFAELGQESRGEPMNDRQTWAIQSFLDAANSDVLQLRFVLEPGQILWFNNLTHLHARTAFEDGDDYENRGHLLRLWLDNDDFRPKSPHLDIYGGDGGIGYQAGKKPSYDEAAEWDKLRS